MADSTQFMDSPKPASARPGRRAGSRAFSVVATLLVLLAAGCRGGSWSEDELKKFYAICAGGTNDGICGCLAQELPKVMSFAAYSEFVAASRAMAPDRLNDETLRKMTHAAAVCAQR
jgi:hypothetical protein